MKKLFKECSTENRQQGCVKFVLISNYVNILRRLVYFNELVYKIKKTILILDMQQSERKPLRLRFNAAL